MTILLLLAISLALWAITLFNRLVRDRQRVRAGWADIDVQLKRRHDLVPKLVAAVEGYAGYERATLETLVELRSRSAQINDPAARGNLEHELGAGLKGLIALAEAYPDLKASDSFLDLQHQLSFVEDQIQFARRYYNGCVRNLNTRIQSFPDLYIAQTFRFEPASYFELEEDAEAEPPEV